MIDETFLTLVNNAAFLLVMGFIYEMMYPGIAKKESRLRSILIGILLGLMGCIVMIMPWQFTEGLTFDTRSIVLSVSGMFFGPLPSVVAGIMTSALRVYQGGIGMYVGIAVIWSAILLGLMWRALERRHDWFHSGLGLYVLGLIVHVVMLLIMLMLPKAVSMPLLKAISLPVMIIFPVGTALLGRLLYNRLQQNLLSVMLQQSRERLLVTLRSIGDGVITTDSEGRIKLLNPVAEELTGWKQQQALNKPLEEIFRIVHEHTRESFENPFDKVMRLKQVVELENHTILLSRDGKEHFIADSGSPIRNSSGEIIGVVLVFRDEGEARKMQERIQRDDKLESLGVLAGGLAHDFNNLLGGLFGYIELATEVTTEPEVKGYLDSALEAFDRARAISTQLLTFAKGGDPVFGSFELDALVRKNASFVLSGSNVRIEETIEEGDWHCRGDENQLGQVIDNLVLNARQAMAQGGVITLAMRQVSRDQTGHPELKPGTYAAISFEDEGPGIPPELQKKIFDPFFTTKPTGNGLGLATCYSIIQRHDGVIDVDSQTGRGTCFTVYLPLSEAVDTIIKKPWRDTRHHGSGTILVLDDQQANAEVTRGYLESFGYTVLVAREGSEALEKVQRFENEPQELRAALLDLTVPGGLGGYEIASRLHKLFPFCELIAISGYSNSPIISKPSEYGFSRALRKPYRKEELELLLQGLLGS